MLLFTWNYQDGRRLPSPEGNVTLRVHDCQIVAPVCGKEG